MKQFKIAILLIIASITLCACPKLDDECSYIIVVNKSGKRIDFQPHLLTTNLTYEDTLFQCVKSIFGVRPNASRYLPAGTHSDWEKEMKGYSYLQIMIIDSDIYDKYVAEPCDTIRKYVPILQRYQLTLTDLQQLNWTITYPPTEAMKNIIMDPPYE